MDPNVRSEKSCSASCLRPFSPKTSQDPGPRANRETCIPVLGTCSGFMSKLKFCRQSRATAVEDVKACPQMRSCPRLRCRTVDAVMHSDTFACTFQASGLERVGITAIMDVAQCLCQAAGTRCLLHACHEPSNALRPAQILERTDSHVHAWKARSCSCLLTLGGVLAKPDMRRVGCHSHII